MPSLFPRLQRWLAACTVALALLATPAAAVAQDFVLPPVDEVFVLSAQAPSRGRIEIEWKIAEGYYLYRHRTSVTANAAFANGKLSLPKGKAYRDEFFGDVETYRRSLTGVFTGTAAEGTDAVTLTVKYQGCADAGICYPPQTRTLQVALPLESGQDGFGARATGGGLFGLGNNAAVGATDAAPLPAEQAFTTEVIAGDGNTLLLRLTPARGYYIYRDKLSVRLDMGAGLSASLPPASRLPKATAHRDEHFGDVAVYFDQVEFEVPVTRTATQAARGTLILGLQGCQDEGICYPPMTRRLAVTLPAGTVTPIAAPGTPLENPDTSTDYVVAITDPLAPAGPGAAAASTSASPVATQPLAGTDADAPPQVTRGLLASLLLALLGGLILNLMPCVLPVLSLKALALAQSGESPQRARKHALAYTAGVLVSFAALGALALVLRQAGLALGWGFQLQQPLVVAVLALLVFALGLSMSGLWYANLGIGQRGGALVQRQGVTGDFFTGVLAVVLATPCTAPFMGAALGYAFTGPAAGGMLVFLMLGLGLALPFLLIGFVPAFARLLPRPGAWMETLKQLLAFPLYATAAWLVWVLAKQRGADAVGLWLAAAITLSLAAWAWTRVRSGGGRAWLVLALIALLGTAWPLATLQRLPKPDTAAAATRHGIASVAFSEQKLADLRAQGRVVFLNMTADWCVSCKANEKAVFARDSFRASMDAANAVYMVGDYTDVDPLITAYLQRHKAVGVPLYVVYPRGGGEGKILPTLLTTGMVRDALAQAAGTP